MQGEKWKQFSLEEKQKILEVDRGVNKCEIVRKHEISPSALSN
jgi:transposase-like protein